MTKRTVSTVLAALAAFAALPGCGESPAQAMPAVPAPAPVAAPAAAPAPAAVPVAAAPLAAPAAPAVPPLDNYDPASATATIVVKATFKGEVPKMRPLKFDADPKCQEQHTTPVASQGVVAKDGKLANVIAWVSKGSEGKTYAAPTAAQNLDQKGCIYMPHVFTVMTGQPIVIKNSDPTNHNIHAIPKKQDEFNQSQFAGAADITQKFSKEEIGVRIKCDVHGWMEAWAGVFAHPFHGVTAEDGTVKLKVPPGEYEISVWQESEKVGKPAAQTVKVGKDESKDLEFVFEPKAK